MNDEKKRIKEQLRLKKQKIIKNSKSIEIGLTLKDMKTDNDFRQKDKE